MLKKSSCVILLVYFVLLVCINLSGCKKSTSTPTLSSSEISSLIPDATGYIISPMPSSSEKPSATSNVSTNTINPPSSQLVEDNVEDIILKIDERVSRIDEQKGLYDGNSGDLNIIGEIYTDYYDDESLVYREGVEEYYELIEGSVVYHLYYDDDGRLTYAYVMQYRAPSYHIYFDNGSFIRLIVGDRTNEPEYILDEEMLHAINLCLENAYKNE